MAEMVAQLLDLTQSRLAGGIPVERAPVDLVAVLSGVLDDIAIANPGARFARVLVSNVVGNAVQHATILVG